MENNMKNFDDLFRDELADHVEVPPGRVWESLEKRLNANAAGKSTFGKGWYWYVGVASVAMLMGTIGWNLADKNSDRTSPALAQVTETVAPPVDEPSNVPQAAVAPSNTRHIASARHSLAPHSYERVAEEHTDDVSPYGNAAATGTKLHSYDDFDERAIASTQKLAPLNSDEEHAALGYKVNRIKKNRLVVAEMVPIHQQEPVLAANASGAKATEATKSVAASRTQARTIAGKLASAQAPKKTVILVNNTGNGETPANNDSGNNIAAPVTAVAPDVKPADKPVSTSMPVPAGTATAAKSKPASEVVIPAKPTTGGSEPVKGASAAQQDNAEDGAQEKKGLFGIFKKKKK